MTKQDDIQKGLKKIFFGEGVTNGAETIITKKDIPYEVEEEKPLPRMLFLDDSTKRIESAREQYSNLYDVTYVHTTKECLRYLCRETYDILSLDHDLGGIDFQDPNDVTSGMEVVRYLEECDAGETIDETEVWVHSSNLFAANAMIKRLNDLGMKAYYKRFQYGDKKESANRPLLPTEDKWVSNHHKAYCPSCGNLTILDTDYKCHDCYLRELISWGG